MGDSERTEEADRLRLRRNGWQLEALGKGLAHTPPGRAWNGTYHLVDGGFGALVEYMASCGPRVDHPYENVMIDILADLRAPPWATDHHL